MRSRLWYLFDPMRALAFALALQIFLVSIWGPVAVSVVLASNASKPYRAHSPLRAFGKASGGAVDLVARKIAYFRAAAKVHWETSQWDFPENTAVLEEGFYRAFRMTGPYESDEANYVLAETDSETGQARLTYTDAEVGQGGQLVSNDGWMGFTDDNLTLPGGPMWVLGRKAHFSASPNSPAGKAYLDQLEARLRHRQQAALGGKSSKDLQNMDGDVDWKPSPFLKIFNVVAGVFGMVSNVWAGNKIGQGASARWTGLEGIRQTSAYMNAAREAFVVVGAWDHRYVNSAGTRADQSLNGYSGLALVKRFFNFEKCWQKIEETGMSPQEMFERKRLEWKPNARRYHKTPLSLGFTDAPIAQRPVSNPAERDGTTSVQYHGVQTVFVSRNPALNTYMVSLRAKIEGVTRN